MLNNYVSELNIRLYLSSSLILKGMNIWDLISFY